MTERQARLVELEARLRAAKVAPDAINLELRRMETEARRRLMELRGALERNPDEARAVLGTIFPSKLIARPVDTPDGRRFQLEGAASVGGVLDSRFSNSASPTGFEQPTQRTIKHQNCRILRRPRTGRIA
jgi:hypothetical protein